MGILITFLLGIFLLAGVLVVRLARGSKVIEQFSISIALGTMCSLAMIELIPEIFETFHGKNLLFAGIAVLVGVLGLKALDHFIPDHEEGTKEDTQTQENVVHIGVMSAIAIVLHNIVEGMAVYSLTAESVKVGALVALGVGLHNMLMAWISPVLNDFVIGILICLALGMLLYIIIFELIPHLIHSSRKGLSVLGTGIGVIIIIISTFLE